MIVVPLHHHTKVLIWSWNHVTWRHTSSRDYSTLNNHPISIASIERDPTFNYRPVNLSTWIVLSLFKLNSIYHESNTPTVCASGSPAKLFPRFPVNSSPKQMKQSGFSLHSKLGVKCTCQQCTQYSVSCIPRATSHSYVYPELLGLQHDIQLSRAQTEVSLRTLYTASAKLLSSVTCQVVEGGVSR